MRITRTISLAAAAVVLFGIDAAAQNRPTTRVPAPPRVITSDTVGTQPTNLKTGAEKVAIQIKNVSKFIYVLGGVAKGIEDLDKDRSANRAARQANEANKQDVIRAMRNLRAGLAALETEFRTKDPLKKHLSLIQGISELSGQAEGLASAGRWVDSGKPLLEVVEKLSDTLVAL